MSTQFVAQLADDVVVAELERLQPANPFVTMAFFNSKRRLGYAAWVFGVRDSTGSLQAGCAGFVRSGRLNRDLEIVSLPALDPDTIFWDGVRDFCRRHGITRAELGTFGSPRRVEPPPLGSRETRHRRCEFVLDLSGDLGTMLGSNHRRNVKKAEKAGLSTQRTRSAEAALTHQALMSESMERRRDRGETVPTAGPSPEILAILDSGAGEVFQAVRDAQVLSSVLVMRAGRGGYYQSAGTSPEGMQVGASHFLIHNIALQLKAEGATVLNLGGAAEDSSLARFKEGFGTSRVALLSTSVYVGPNWRRRVARGLELVRSDRKKLRHLLTGDYSRLVVYATDTASIPIPEQTAGLEFRALSPEDLRDLPVRDQAFRARQLERLERFGGSYAYGVSVGGAIAHVSWLLPPAAMEKDDPRVIRPTNTEAEITSAETLPEFRGRGIYGFAIRNLVHVARNSGVRRVFMKTTSANRASQAGIEKSGLKRIGWAMLVTLPLSQQRVIWRWFR